jgi:hypothetical protein
LIQSSIFASRKDWSFPSQLDVLGGIDACGGQRELTVAFFFGFDAFQTELWTLSHHNLASTHQHKVILSNNQHSSQQNH